MPNMFKKALGLFVEFAPDTKPTNSTWNEDALPMQVKADRNATGFSGPVVGYTSQKDIDKFEKHFEELFDSANLPGPDYYEFWKMMEALEKAVPDESTRISAVFSTLKIQGLSKEVLINSAEKYLQLVDKDKLEFQQAVNTKVLGEIEGRKSLMEELEKKDRANNELIQKLTREINDNQQKITALKKEVIDEEAKINNNKNGYHLACDAMLAKLRSDMQKIKTNL